MHQHTNRLINETSPYLLQHAHNPVDWYPWSDEALQLARAADKPILVSIGYAACHWCHVMERESFEDASTAELMNKYFINIKIDREERPDIDHVYMDAVQAMTGSGGWPLNVFLLPDGKPFYGGTYFPPERAFNRPSWKEILEGVHQAYTERKHEMESQAENLTAHLNKANSFGIAGSKDAFTQNDLDLIAENMLKQGDKEHGGFGAAPKFPQTFTIQYLLRHYYYTKDEESRKQALLSLDKMIYGGIYDQLGGGFARYSTDAEWLAPHFEKMLYDNALLLSVMAEAYQLTNNELYRNTIQQTIRFIERELTSAEGGFYSALDADSEGVEGKCYTWSKSEVEEVLGADAAHFCEYYDITEEGNWEHTNILRIKQSLKEFAIDRNLDALKLQQVFDNNRQQLFAVRENRVRPGLDDKILLGWNALMNIALSKAYAATLNESYRRSAISNMAFLEAKLQREGTWYHTYKGEAKIPAFLDDLAYLVLAYIQLQEITGNSDYLLSAKELTQTIIQQFSDESQVLFYYTQKDQTDVIVRKKEIYDGATPSGNAVMAHVLLYLSKLFDRPEWEERAVSMVTSFRSVINQYPTSFGFWAQQAQLLTTRMEEIAIVGERSAEFLNQLLPVYLPGKLLQTSVEGDDNFPLLRSRSQKDTLVYHCKNYVCAAPYTSVSAFLDQYRTQS